MTKRVTQYNEQQLEAINSTDRTILCLAAAGCGKTGTLLGRIEHSIKDLGVDPKSILALTFTNAAAFEMKERYKLIPNLDLSKGTPEFRTFHSFCYSLIIKDSAVRSKLGYTKIPTLCDDNKLKEIKTRVKMAIGCKLSDAQIESGKHLTKQEQEDRKIFNKALIKELKKENAITFDIMCYNVCELFERKDESIEIYRNKYKHIYIDEFQDTDARQARFANSFPATTNFWLCADALQCIYQFRGTSNRFVKQLSTAPGWKVVKLYKNYRSTRQICEYANKFSKYAKDDYRVEMEGQRDGEPVETVYGSSSTYNSPVDEDHLSLLIDKIQMHDRETAILCRTNKECAAVRNALTRANITFSSRSKSTDHVNILESALSNEYMLEWLSTKLDVTEYGDYIRSASQTDNPDIRWFLDKYGTNSQVKIAAEKVIAVRNVTASDLSPKEKFEAIAKLMRSKTKCTFEGDENSTNKEIVKSVRDQVQSLEEARVYVGTIHSVKGLEYDTVYVMGVDDKMFELGTEEMNNLFYVAITRAKEHLTIFRR